MNIAIAGFGIEGQSSYRYFTDQGHDVTIIDEKELPPGQLPEGAMIRYGSDAYRNLNGFDRVVRTPGLRPDKITTDGEIWSATNEFFEKCPASIIGVTGTKGKGTTCSLIASILEAAGETVHLVGNIGKPALDELHSIKPSDFVVYELSSFQLWDLQYSPHVAVVLMIEPDHLDVHKDMDEYLDAKANIRRHQSNQDACLYHPTNEYSRRIAATPCEGPQGSGGALAPEHRGSNGLDFAYRYAVEEDHHAYVKDGFFCVQQRKLCPTSVMSIPGAFNLDNACAAISAVMEVTERYTDENIAEGLRNFTGLPHRLKFVREVLGVKYYDDSIATTPGSAIAALQSFDKGQAVIILGGSDKGSSYDEVVRVCAERDATVIAIGQTGEAIRDSCEKNAVDVVRVMGGMQDVVEAAARQARSGQIVILSPASASFDQYTSYVDRGNQFISAVKEMA